MAKTLNFAVVGLGMGMHHCKAIQQAKGAALTAVCDTDEARRETGVRQFDCKGYARYADLLRDTDVDAVCVVTESGKHAKMGIQAARAGKHLIMEKPVDVRPAAITELEETVRETGVKCGCIFQYRMDNCNRMLKRAIEKGKMGNLIGVHAHLPWFRAASYYDGPHGAWRGTWRWDGGGSLMNQGIHTLDLAIFLGGPVHSVAGFYGVYNHQIQSEDQTVAVLQFANGALGTLYTTTCALPEGAQHIYLYGTKGSFSRRGNTLEFCEMGTPRERARMMELFGGKEGKDAASSDPMAVSADGHLQIIEDLVKAVRNDREPVIPLAAARHAVDVARAIYRSGKTGRVVKIGE